MAPTPLSGMNDDCLRFVLLAIRLRDFKSFSVPSIKTTQPMLSVLCISDKEGISRAVLCLEVMNSPDASILFDRDRNGLCDTNLKGMLAIRGTVVEAVTILH